jgi:hypothetical protein
LLTVKLFSHLWKNVLKYITKAFPHFAFNNYLSLDAQIVHSKEFESAIIKIQTGKEDELTHTERMTIKPLRKTAVVNDEEDDEVDDFAEKIIKRQPKADFKTAYCNLDFCLPTSNDVERLFSLAKRVFSTKRREMSPKTLEALLFLRR